MDMDPSRSRGIWAPEFHYISNRWYLYYTATSSDNDDDHHRMHVLESAGRDPLGPYHYRGRLINPTNDAYAIDGTVFQKPDGTWYFVWAARPGHVLTIARMANPWTLSGNGVVLPASGFGCAEVREGPVVLKRNGRLFLVYSACDTGKPDYKLGLLVAKDTAEVLDPKSWRQHATPVFERNDANGVFGPGHNGFFRAADGLPTGSSIMRRPPPTTRIADVRPACSRSVGTPTARRISAHRSRCPPSSANRSRLPSKPAGPQMALVS